VIGSISIDILNTEVAVWRTDKQRRKFLRSHGVEVERHNDACFSSAHMDVGPDGVAWFSMVIKDGATMATWAHECVHIKRPEIDHGSKEWNREVRLLQGKGLMLRCF